MTYYNDLEIGLFGKRCRIKTGYDERPFIYRIVASGIRSNAWCEVPITYQSEHNPVIHDTFEDILIVVADIIISDESRLLSVALKDVEIIEGEKMTIEEAMAWLNTDDHSAQGYAEALSVAFSCMERCKRVDEEKYRVTLDSLDYQGGHVDGWNDCLAWAKGEISNV